MKSKPKKTPNRFLRIMLIPIIALVFFAGFITSIVGEKKNNQKLAKKQHVNQKAYNLQMQLNVPEENQTVKVEDVRTIP
jgi:hypothetical protein